jgi:putative Ig domain-containing protein
MNQYLPETRSSLLKRSAALLLALVPATLLSGCGAAHKRDKTWANVFESPGYEAYVRANVLQTKEMKKDHKPPAWVQIYDDDLKKIAQETDLKKVDPEKAQAQADRNKIVNGYLLLADTAYGKFEGGYNTEIASFEIGADLVNLGLTAAAAVTPPAALLGAAATGSLGVQHSVEKNALNAETRFVITNRMGAIREKQRALILQRELLPVSCPTASPVDPGSTKQPTSASDVCYTLEAAMVDVNQYFQLGTISRALADIDSSTQQISKAAGNQAQTAGQIVIASKDAATFTVGTPGTFTVTATGTPTPKFTPDGSWPSGVTFTDNGDGTATLSGTPAPDTKGPHKVTIKAHNGVGQDQTQNFTLTVQ